MRSRSHSHRPSKGNAALRNLVVVIYDLSAEMKQTEYISNNESLNELFSKVRLLV